MDELVNLLAGLRMRSASTRADGTSEYIMDEFSRVDASRILNALDADENGTLDQKEWTDWISTGLADTEARQRLVKRAQNSGNPLAQKLKQLLDATETVVNEWIVAEGGKIKRRKSFYERTLDVPSTKRAVARSNSRMIADPSDVDALSTEMHHLCCEEFLTVQILEDFFVVHTTPDSFNTDLMERASCQLDPETHMTALHFLCWHEHLEAPMLRLFLENTGSAALAVSFFFFFSFFLFSPTSLLLL